jgi:23S rRNA (guanosine2251-2'-O)-methyltransferase
MSLNIRKLSMQELNRLSPGEFRKAEKLPLTVVLDNIRSQNNTGSVFRTSDAFLAEQIYLCGITATPPHREIRKTALGAEDAVIWKYYGSTTEAVLELKHSGYTIIAVEQTNSGTTIGDLRLPVNPRLAVVFGNEINGIGDEIIALADVCLEIPQFGTKHSLNVSVTAGIILWEIVKKLKKL